MYKDFSNMIYASDGVFSPDAIENYQKVSPTFDFPNDSIDVAISKYLKQLFAENIPWKHLLKEPFRGTSKGTIVTKFKHNRNTYFFKLTERKEVHFGMILGNITQRSHHVESLEFVDILKHGTLNIKGVSHYFLLLSEAKGTMIPDLLKKKQYSDLDFFASFVGSILAKNHSRSISEATPNDKIRYSINAISNKAENLYFRDIQITTNEQQKIVDQYVTTVSPQIIVNQIDYLSTRQNKTFATTVTNINNLAFKPILQQATLFDTSAYTKFCGPNSEPSWSPEDNFMLFFRILDFASLYFNLDQSRINKSKEIFVCEYLKILKQPVMSQKGLKYFQDLGVAHSLKWFTKNASQKPQYIDHAKTLFNRFNQKHEDISLCGTYIK